MAEDELNQFPEDYFQYDKANLLEQYSKVGADIKSAYLLGDDVELFDIQTVDKIFFLGMGGSAISSEFARMLLNHLGSKIPVFSVKDYNIPSTMTENSLVFAVSYSGNTEETLSAFKEAQRITRKCVGLASGGRLEELFTFNRLPFIKVPKGYQPRTAAISYLFFPILRILERLGIIPTQQASVQELVKGIVKPDFKTYSINISEKLFGTIPIIYASDKYYPVAYRFKSEINENAKIHAFSHSYSEFNHNEILGYTRLESEKYHIVTFHFDDDHRRIHKRMELVKDLTNKAGVETTEIKLTGTDFLTKVFTAILIGDLSAYYLALRYKTDPSPVEIIENLKKNLGTPVL
ncbi:bifunctional phosphoglucose/phosphomannose isomerase [Candidatus Woesearchaeota archaeon]|nr:bifunctional phosphoglucose/phosphomannose isomerase [Candidatus Woesearchaeota archaeon]